MKKMLINAVQREELRIAIVKDKNLIDLDIEVPGREQKLANIYKAKITRVEPSLDAVFVNFGGERHGFLPVKEIAKEYFLKKVDENGARPPLTSLLKEGQELLVQLEKEERGNKGAALTTYVSLAGRYLVLMPNNGRAGGISRKIEGDDRQVLRDVVNEVVVPDSMGMIVRTAGIGRSSNELQWDLDYLVSVWSAIQRAFDSNQAPMLLYQESNAIIRAMRDYLRQDIEEVLIDDEDVFQQVKEFVSRVMPSYLGRVKFFRDNVPIFNYFQIDRQIESAFLREVTLKSGGSIVIDRTEALTAVDVNSAKATKGDDIEQTALHTNCEAAEEVARQLRLRELGGLVVIDFIDMMASKDQKAVEDVLKRSVGHDKARVQIGRISRFGLLEMSRQRIRSVVGEATRIVCPLCDGQGAIRDLNFTILTVLRMIEENAFAAKKSRPNAEVVVQAVVPVPVAAALMNERRKQVIEIEAREDVSVYIVPNTAYQVPHYHISVLDDPKRVKATHTLTTSRSVKDKGRTRTAVNAQPMKVAQEPAVKMILPQKQSMFESFISSCKRIFGLSDDDGSHKGRRRGGQSRRGGRRQDNQSGGRHNNNRNRRDSNHRNRTQGASATKQSAGHDNTKGQDQNRGNTQGRGQDSARTKQLPGHDKTKGQDQNRGNTQGRGQDSARSNTQRRSNSQGRSSTNTQGRRNTQGRGGQRAGGVNYIPDAKQTLSIPQQQAPQHIGNAGPSDDDVGNVKPKAHINPNAHAKPNENVKPNVKESSVVQESAGDKGNS